MYCLSLALPPPIKLCLDNDEQPEQDESKSTIINCSRASSPNLQAVSDQMSQRQDMTVDYTDSDTDDIEFLPNGRVKCNHVCKDKERYYYE